MIIADITNSENTTAYAVARDIAESSNNLGATVSQIGVIKGDTIVNYAVNNLNQIKLITNNGTIISAEKQLEYDRLLFDFIERGNVYLVSHVLDEGANVEAKKGNMTPLMSAVFSRKNGEIMIDLLLDRGANIDAKSADNWTAAKWAVYCRREDLVIQLVNKGADIGYRDNINHTLLDTAERLGQRRIADFLRGKQSEEPLKRKRRHHHARHHSGEQKYLQEKERTTYLESKGASHSIENDHSVIKNNQATSGASKPSSWINVFANSIVDAVKGVSQFISSPFRASLPLTSENSSNHSDKIRNPSNQYTGQFGSEVCMSNNVALGFFLLQSFLDKKYPLPKFYSITPEEALTNTLNITGKFEQILRETAKQSGISVKDFDFFTVYLNVAYHVRNERYSQIPTTLYSSAKDACPENEKFLSILKGNIKKMLDGQQIVNNRNGSNQMQNTIGVSDKMPLSSLNSIAIEPLNGKKVVICAGRVA